MKVYAKDVQKGRTQSLTFPSSESKAKGILEIIHSDVCRPISLSSPSGYVYHVSFIDDFTRNTWIYFMKNKDEVFSNFEEFKSLIKNYTERKSRHFDQTMAEYLHQLNLKHYTEIQGLIGS